MTHNSTTLVASIFDTADADADLARLAGRLRVLWEEDRWDATSIDAVLSELANAPEPT